LRAHGLASGYIIGFWAWELAKFPEEWRHAFSFVDEVWAATRFAYEAFMSPGSRPVTLMPQAVSMPETDRGLDRRHFRIPEDRFTFLFTFDFNSYYERKNPLAAIEAFRRAFPGGREKAGLL